MARTIKYFRRCYARRYYYVPLKKMVHKHGCWSNFISTASLAQARRLAKKLPLKWRQIDVRIKGRQSYVLDRSWL
jgi:hypothetical protein